MKDQMPLDTKPKVFSDPSLISVNTRRTVSVGEFTYLITGIS
jgi:hypothetical protein